MDETTRRELARFSAALVDEHFRDEAAQRLLLDLLEEVRQEGTEEVDLVARYPHVRYDQLHARRANRICSWKLADREQRLESMREELETTKRHLDELRTIQSEQSAEISQLRLALQRLSDETE